MQAFDRLYDKLLQVEKSTDQSFKEIHVSKNEFEFYWSMLFQHIHRYDEVFSFIDREGFEHHALLGLELANMTSQPKLDDQKLWVGGERFAKIKKPEQSQWNNFIPQDENSQYFAPLFGLYAYRGKYTIFIQGHFDKRFPSVADFCSYFQDPSTDQDLVVSQTDLKSSTLKPANHHPSFEEWKRMIETVQKNFTNIPKVVLARSSSFTDKNTESYLNHPSSFSYLIDYLYKKNHEHKNFFLFLRPQRGSTFISITPEKLFSLNLGQELKLSIDAIAGTRKRDLLDQENDDRLAIELESNEKELAEHRFVKNEVIRSLDTIKASLEDKGIPETSISMKSVFEEDILKLKHVQHLHSLYEMDIARENSEQINISELNQLILSTLHPTPAVGGQPKQAAIDLIEELESSDRGFYAAPVGIISPDCIQYTVAIRSALINQNNISVYAGAGIVEGSDALAEWKETENKMKNFTEVLENSMGHAIEVDKKEDHLIETEHNI